MNVNEIVVWLIFLQLIMSYACVFMMYCQVKLSEEIFKYLKKEKRRRKSNNGRK